MEQSKYQEQGMHLLAVPKRRQMLLPLLGISVFGFVAFFVGIAIFMGAWEEAGGVMLLCMGLAAVILAAGLFTGYCLKEQHIWYDEEKLLIGMTGYHEFYNMAAKCCMPERA